MGNELGAGNPLRAKRAAFTAVGIMGTLYPSFHDIYAFYRSVFSVAVFISIIMAIVLGLSRHTVARIFTSDQ